MKQIITTVLLTVFLVLSSFAQVITDQARLNDISAMLVKQRQLSPEADARISSALIKPLSPDERQCLQFLYAYMPLSDMADYDAEFFLEQVRATLKARSETSWGNRIPEDIFLHFVLPVRVNNENLDNFRNLMYNTLIHRIKGMSMHEAALEINHWCHEKVTYRGSDERTSSPLATIKTSFGRCGEESTFTVAAMRCAGIPARQVYTPRWAHTDDNHAWVEVWIDGKWYYMGACEPEPELNMGWFSAPALRAMLVHTRAYGKYFGNEEIIDAQEKFAELNLIRNYAPAKTFFVKVVDDQFVALKDALVEFQLYNYAEFYPIAKKTTDINGICRITSGLGDLLIWASKDNKFNFSKITVETTDTLLLQLDTGKPSGTYQFDMIPPIERNAELVKVTDRQQEANKLALHCEDSIRNTYMSTFADSSFAVNLAQRNGIDISSTLAVFKETYGNYKEIASFIEMQPAGQKTLALEFLKTLTQKDLRDSDSKILDSHFNFGISHLPDIISDTGFYTKYVLSPRISIEFIRPWRKELSLFFNEFRSQSLINTVISIRDWTLNNIIIDPVANMHSRAPVSPLGVFKLRVSDVRSRNIFLVAACRSIGIPARIDQVTGLPQFFNSVSDNWIDIPLEKETEKKEIKEGYLSLVTTLSEIPAYGIQFAIAGLKDGFYRTLEYDFGKKLDEFDILKLKSGDYYLITGNRLDDGSVLTEISFFNIGENDTTPMTVELKEKYESLPALGSVRGSNLKMLDLTTKRKTSLEELPHSNGFLLVWVEPGKEPTRHVLVELPRIAEIIEKKGMQVILLIPADKVPENFNPLENMPKESRLWSDKNFKLLESCGSGLSSLSAMPVVMVVNNKFEINRISKGYTIGIAEQIAKVLKKME